VDPSGPDLPLPIHLVIYSAGLDLDPMAVGREERAHRGKDVNNEVGGSGVRWRPAPVVFNAQKYVDGVPLEETEAMARRCPRWNPVTTMRGSWRFSGGLGCYGRDRA
jgi:hypothetical protein